MASVDKEKTASVKGFKQRIQNFFLPKETMELMNKIAAKEEIINSQILKFVEPDLANSNERVVWPRWININNWANYFANRFKYDTKNTKYNLIINNVLRYGFIYGDCGVWNNNGTPTIAYFVKDLSPTKCLITIHPTSNQEEALKLVRESRAKSNNATIQIDKKDFVNYQFEPLGYSAFLTLKPVLETEEMIQKLLINEVTTAPTKTFFKVAQPDGSKRLMSAYLSNSTPILVQLMDSPDKIAQLQSASGSQEVLNLIEATKNWYYDILGRRTNSDFKLSHTLEQEAQNSAANVNAIEWGRYLLFRDFMENFAKIFKCKNLVIENFNGTMSSLSEDINWEENQEREQENDFN